MGSEADVSEVSALFERLVRNRDMSLFLPFIFGLSESNSRGGNTTEEEEEEGQEDQDGETGGRGSTEAPNRERIILVNPFTQGMVVIDGASSLEALLREIGNNNNNNNSNNSFGKGGQPPASKESIEAMPRVEVKGGEEEEGGGVGECVVCLEELSVGVVVKEMPCRHRFHPDCIETWLGIHGSCPVCRYEMPVEERDEGKKRDEEGGERRGVGGGGGGGNGEVWVSFSINRDSRRSQEDQNQAPAAGDDDSSDSTSSPSGDAEVEG